MFFHRTHTQGGNHRVCACGKLKNNTAKKQNEHSQRKIFLYRACSHNMYILFRIGGDRRTFTKKCMKRIRCRKYTKYPNIGRRTSRKFITQAKTTLLPAKTYKENWKKHRRRFCFMRFRTTYAVHYRGNSVNGLVLLCTRKYFVFALL